MLLRLPNVHELLASEELLRATSPNERELSGKSGSEPLYLVIQTAVTCTDTSSDATVAFTLESDSATALNSSPTVHFSTGALAFAAYATAGTRVAVTPLPFGDYKRYLGVRYTVASGPLTAGAFDAFLTRDPQFWNAQNANNPQAR